jgi:TP901 family phage tail tape measure protein
MAVQISVQASQTALAQSIAQGVAAFNARYAAQNQLNLQVNTRSFSQPLGRITGNLKEFESALAASNARVLAFGASTAVIGGVGKAFKEIADVTIEVEKSLSDINRVLGLSTDKLQKFSSELFSVSKLTAASFQDAAKASLEFSRQGLSAEDTLKKTADALTLVRLTGVSATQAVEDLTAATNAFKDAGLTTNDILNKIVAVEQQFAVSADDLTSAVSRTGQAAKEAGVNFDQLNALVASAQEKTARGGAVIGNALKTIFTRLQRTETLDQLENFNIAVRDIEGNVLPAIQILQNFAGAYKDLSTAQKASLSEQVAGVYQVNILKSIISDLNNEQGVYNKALEYGAKATNEAEQANAKLNLTLAALISQTGTNLQQLSNNIGKVTFEPVFKSLVSPFNDAITYINDLLEGEGIGSQFANGLLLGIKNILSGPGLVGAVAVIGKVITNTFSYASTALPALFGITTETQKRKNIEEAVLKIIQSQSQVSLALQGQQGNLTAQAQTLFNLAQAQTAEYQQQLATAKQLAAALAPRNINVGQAGLQVGKIKAGGYIPRDVQNAEVMGAAIGGYKAGKVIQAPVGGVMNSAEKVKYVPGFAQPFINPPEGSKAGRLHRMKSINQTGVDPYAADGFIPNFASIKKTDYILGTGFKGDLRSLPLSKSEEKEVGSVANLRTMIGSNFITDTIGGKKGIYYKIKEVKGKTNEQMRKEAEDIAMFGSKSDIEKYIPTGKSADFDFDLWFKNRNLPNLNNDTQVERLTKNTGKGTVSFADQKRGLVTLLTGEIFEQRISELEKLTRSKVSNDRFDFLPSDVTKFLGGEAKAGEFNLGNLVAKAIGVTPPGNFKNKKQDNIRLNLPIELYVPEGHPELKRGFSKGFIPNFATGLSPKVTRLPWLKAFANKEWFDRFPWFNDIDLKNTHQNMDYNPYTGERKLIPGSEMFRELNFLSHGNNKNLKTGNSPLFSYLYEEYVREILNAVTQGGAVLASEEAGFPVRDKFGNPVKFDPFTAANTAPMDALIRSGTGKIGGIEIKGGTEENWKTKDILKKEQDFEAQNPGSTLGKRTRVYSNMYKGTDFLTKGLLKRLGVNKAKIITNKLISFYADKIAGHESEITNSWRANKGLSEGFIPHFAKFKSSFGTATLGKTDPIDLEFFSKTLGRKIKASDIVSIEDLTTKGKGNAAGLYGDIANSIKGKGGVFGYALAQDRPVDPRKANDPLSRLKAKYPQIAKRIGLGGETFISGDYGQTIIKATSLQDLIKNQDKILKMVDPAILTLKSFANGFIPNFAYQQAVMNLEEGLSGNKAILDTTTGPFPFVRNTSQPNFASAIADHGGLNKALSDSMAGQKATGLMAAGNIPNFAAPNPITLTGKGYAGNTKVEQAINNYLKSIDILTVTNGQIKTQLDNLEKTLGLTGQEFKKLKAEVVAHANAERQAAQAFIGPMPQQNAPINQRANAPLLPGRGTVVRNMAAMGLRNQRNNGFLTSGLAGLGNNIGFSLGVPLIAGQLESAITRGRDRSEMSVNERFAASATSSALTNLSTGSSLGTVLAPLLGPLAPFGPLIGAAGGALVGLTTAAIGASDNLEDLQKKAEDYRSQTQSTVEAGKGIIDTVKALGSLDPNSLEAFDANKKLEEYFVKISETGLDEKFREAGTDVEKMTEAIKAYEMERMAGAKRVTESANRMAKKELSIEDLGKKQILRTEKKAVTKFTQTQSYGPGGIPSSYVTMEEQIANTGAAGEANFKKIVTQNTQLFADLENIQKQLGVNFEEFATEFKNQFYSVAFDQDKLSDLLKKHSVTGINADALAIQLQEVARDNGDYGRFIVNNFDEIIKGLVSGKYKTAVEAAKAQKEIAQRQEGVRQKLFQYSQAIEQSLAATAMQIENYDFEKSFGKLNLEKSSQLINDGLAAISKNIDDSFKNQFNFLMEQTSNLQQQRMLEFDAATFQQDLGLQKQSRRLGRSKDLISVLQGALEETAAGNIEEVVTKFQRTGTVDISGISGLKKGEESKRAIEAFNLSTRISEQEAANKEDNARKTFMAEQAYAKKSLDLKNETGKLDYDLSQRRYKNTLREKELVDSITTQNKQIQIKGQAEIERGRIATESPYFMLGRGEYDISDEKRRREVAATRKGIELEARQAIADAEIARIQREVLADNTDATLANTTAIENLIMSMTKEGADKFASKNEQIKRLDEQIIPDAEMTQIDEDIKSYKKAAAYRAVRGDDSSIYNSEITQLENKKAKQEELRKQKANILSDKEYASNKASSEIYNRQLEMQVARQELQKRKVQGGAFSGMDLSTVKDPIAYLQDKTSQEKKNLELLEAEQRLMQKRQEDGLLNAEGEKKLAGMAEKIVAQKKLISEIDTANLAIQTKLANETEREKQAAEDRAKRGKFGTGVSKALGEIRTEVQTFEERLGGTTVMAFRDGLVGAMDAAINKTDDLGSALLEVAGGFLKTIQNAMFQQIANQMVSGIGFAAGKQKGGVIRAQAGMYISDAGRTGDVNPALLEDGEYVLNRKTVEALGGPEEIDKLNFGMFPRFGTGARRFANGGNTGSIQAAASMNEPFAELSEFGKENNPEYQKYLERIREEQAKKDAKKAQRSALIRSLIGTALTTGIMMGVGSIAKGMTGPKVAGAKPSSTQLSQLQKAGVTINESGLPNMQKGGVLHFANGGYLPYGNRLNDSIPALLSGGEYIVNSKAVRRYGVGGLNKINSGVARFEDGGLVGDATKTNANTESMSSNNVSVNITVNATDGKAQNEQSSADGADEKNRALGNKIKEVVLQVITNEQRTGGLLDSTKKK